MERSSNGIRRQVAIAAAVPSIGILLIGLFLYIHDQVTPSEIKPSTNTSSTTSMLLTSPSFKNNGPIPQKFTCDGFDKLTAGGGDINPALEVANVPPEAKSLALIMDDPDALASPKPSEGGPSGTFTHWTVWNINPQITFIKEESTPPGSVEGNTGFGKIGYGGPCPPASPKPSEGGPSGTHHYHFKLFALDSMLNLPEGAKLADLEKEIQKHLIAETELVGTYQRK